MNKNQTVKFLTVILSVMFSVFLSMTFTACSSDDDDPLTTKQMLEGNWNFNGGDVSFSSNGQFQMNYNQENMSGTWIMDGDEWIIVSLSDKARSTSNILYFQIISLNKDNISLKIFESRDENGNGVNEILDLTMDKVGGDNSDGSSVVGVWKDMGWKYYADKECTIETGRDSGDNIYIEFTKDGKMIYYKRPEDGYENYKPEIDVIYQYKYDSKKKTMTLSDHGATMTININFPTSSTMTMMSYEEGEWAVQTLKRVSAVGK